MSRARHRERWSLLGRRADPVDAGARLAGWLLDAVAILAPDASLRTVEDEARAGDEVVLRRLGLEGTRDGTLVARARCELALSRGERPSGAGRVELSRVAPWTRVTIDTHGGEEHWDVDAFGVTAATLDRLREAHAAVMGATPARGGARRDPPEPTPVRIVAADAAQARLWREDLAALPFDAAVDGATLAIAPARLRGLDEAFAAQVALGEILAEAGVEAWDERALVLLLALDAG